jgi:hypothetical protein
MSIVQSIAGRARALGDATAERGQREMLAFFDRTRK